MGGDVSVTGAKDRGSALPRRGASEPRSRAQLLDDRAADPATARTELVELVQLVCRTAGARLTIQAPIQAATATSFETGADLVVVRGGEAGSEDLAVVVTATLRAPDGSRVGTLDLVDRPGRTLTIRESRLFELLTRQAEVLARRDQAGTDRTGVALVDGTGALIGANAELERLFGWPFATVEGADVLSFIHPDDLPGAIESFARTASFSGPKIPYDLRFRTSDGTWMRLETTADNRLDDPDVGAIVFRLRDAHDRSVEASTLADQARVLEMVGLARPLRATLEAIAEMLASQEARTTASISLVATGDGGESEPIVCAPTMPDDLRAVLALGPPTTARTALTRGQAVLDGDLDDHPDDRSARALTAIGYRAVWSRPIVIGGGELVGTVDVYRRVAGLPDSRSAHHFALATSLATLAVAQHRLDEERTHRATHDSLTGLVNRHELNAHLSARLAADPEGVGVILVDLDRFQLINDSLGHAVGDQLLVQVAARFREAVNGDGLVARLGGDEFAAVVDHSSAPDATETVAAALMESLAAPFDVVGNRLYVTACAGIAIHGDQHDAGALLRDADAALYRAKAKHTGTSSIQVYAPEIGVETVQSFVTETALRGAIRNDEFIVHYQPVFDLLSGQMVGLESLVRWPHSAFPMIRPDQFIPLAERTGLIDDIDLIVLRRTCEQIQIWNHDRLAVGLAPIVAWVNIAPEHLLRPCFTTSFSDVLEATGVPSEWIGIEITERSRLGYYDDSRAALEAMRDLGVAIAIDDFGTGYASISYLDELPATVLKIDQTFTRQLHRPRTQATVRCILDLAETFDLTVVAEGVETAAQQQMLTELGCHHAQGFHLLQPLPTDRLAPMIVASGLAFDEPRTA